MDGLEEFEHDIKVMLKSGYSIQNCKDFLNASGEEGDLEKFILSVKNSIR